ncbi:MAG: NosD domain-containing protein [Candidatus Heimdallarchaeota archaeon]
MVDKIIITQDEDFNGIYNLPGNGTKDNPYRIENTQQRGTHRIEISNTTKFFVIQNCELKNLWGETIVISNVTSGTALIQNNMFIQDRGLYYHFIKITFTANCSIIDNNFINEIGYGGMKGIYLDYSNQIKIIDNYFFNLEEGISIFNSHQGNISKNVFETNYLNTSDGGIELFACNNVSIVENSIQNVFSGIHCTNANYVIIQNNSINLCNYSIGMQDTIYCFISQNIVNNTNRIGVNIGSTDYCIISNNSIGYSGSEGMVLSRSQFNNVTCNSFLNNEEHALSLSISFNNTLWNNNFLDNNPNGTVYGVTIYYQQAFDNAINDWYNVILAIGNYWSDLLWNATATYIIDYASNIDLHPLEFPV